MAATSRVFSRSGAEVTRAHPEVQDVAPAVKHRRLVLDGEVHGKELPTAPNRLTA